MKKNIIIFALLLVIILGYYLRPANDNTGYKDYQIECTMDSIYLFDYGIRVGAIPYDSSKFVTLILNDNQ